MNETDLKETDPKVAAFLHAYGRLRDEHKLDFISVPYFVPTDHGTWEVQIIPQVMSIEEKPFIT